jgi:poly(hydroxyalkanoate) granule-associated protein
MTRTKRNTQVNTLMKFKKSAISKVEAARKSAMASVGEARDQTVRVVTQLEKVFEQRVQKAISRLGVPSAAEVRALSRQVAELKANVAKLRRARA